MPRLVFGFAALLIVLGAVQGCAGVAGPAAPAGSGAAVAVDAPQYRVGDRWVYRVRSGWRDPIIYDETRTVTAVGSDGVTVAVAVRGGAGERRPRRALARRGQGRAGNAVRHRDAALQGALDRYRLRCSRERPGTSGSTTTTS